MSTAELKNKLIAKINSADKKVLQEILDWLNFESDEKMYITNEQEQSVIREAQEQIEKGKFFSNEQIDEATDLWLEK